MKKVVTILGARPQFIKAAAFSNQLRDHWDEVLVHTGQHYDANMSSVFFKELGIPEPKYNLNIGSGSHGAQTGEMLSAIEKVLDVEQPDVVLVYGDTNSTLAGALAASKLLIPVIHIEAGLRSFNRAMPEEQNRILTDHLSALLFAPTETAVQNLRDEGISNGVHLVGDLMFDGILHFKQLAEERSSVLEENQLENSEYIVCTIHRAENTNLKERLKAIFEGLAAANLPIVLPLHPRTLKYVNEFGITICENIKVIAPVGYLDMVKLMSNAAKIVTDSGGIQKEAFFLEKPCITLRDETEWVETVENGWNILVGANAAKIDEALRNFTPKTTRNDYFGNGDAVAKMIQIMQNFQA